MLVDTRTDEPRAALPDRREDMLREYLYETPRLAATMLDLLEKYTSVRAERAD